MTIHKLKLSINKGIVNKTPIRDKRSLSEGFETAEVSLNDLAKFIKQGFALSYEFKDGRRLTKNFISASFLAVDVDGGVTLEESLNEEFIKKFCSLIYTTHSHTEEVNRFRLIFALPRSINNPLELRYATRSLASKLGGDKSVVDAARMFYGFKGAKIFIHKNRSIDEETLQELISDGETEVISDSVANNGSPSATRSSYLLHKKELITLSSGKQTSLDKIKGKTAVFCPSHRDKNASAFVSRNKHGVAYLYCSTCQMTRWEAGVQDHILSTENFENALLSIQSKKVESKSLMGLEEFMTKGFDISIKNSPVQNEKHLLLEKINDGITFIKSPKGTGKTYSISNALKSEVDSNSGKNKKILLIGHRQALIRNLCNQMGLNCYLNEDSSSSKKFRDRYGICLDSLLKIKDSTYDIVVIDEVEQVLSHFLSETIGSSNAPQIFREFSRLLARAKKVVVMDADLGWTSVLTLTRVITSNRDISNKHLPLNFLINQWKAPNNSILLYKQKDHLLGVMRERLKEGKKVFFTSNSKSAVKELAKALAKEKISGRKIRLIAVTSENSSTKPVQLFINDIKKQIINYDIVLTSPSLSTGIDITFENNVSEIDCVFGVFENRINAHPEIDQQISRVRNPKEVHLWISPMRYNFETEFDVVEEDYLKNRLSEVVIPVDDVLSGVEMKSVLLDFINMATWITVLRRSSLNNLRGNYIEYKKRQGVEIIPIDSDKSSQDIGRKLRVLGRTISDGEYLSNVLKADVLSRAQYKDLKTKTTLNEFDASIGEVYSMRRYEIQTFYGESISKDLILLDNYGKFRNQVRTYEQLTDRDYFKNNARNDNIALSLENKLKLCVIKVDIASRYLLADLFGVTNFYSDCSFNQQVTFDSNQLFQFVINAKRLKRYIEGQLGIQVRNDINYKPISQLKQFLKFVGLDVKQIGKQVVGGKKHYYYSISSEKLTLMNSIIKQRKKRDIHEDDASDLKASLRGQKTIKIPILEESGINLESFFAKKSRK